MNFSICLIAKNEEKTLSRLLGSLKEFQENGGEILLLDTGSTDKTIEVAKQNNVIVHAVGDKFLRKIDKKTASEINRKFDFDNKPIVKENDTLFDFAAARNYIAELAPTDMIAMPDCDEEFTTFDLEKIEKVISEGAEQLEYNFVFSHDEYGNEIIKFLHSKFYNRKKLKWTGIIHEVLVGDAKRVFLPEDICKLEHWQNHETNRSKYLTGLALDCFLNPDNDRNSHYFGRELFWAGRIKSAIQELKRHIALNKWPAEKSQSMIFLAKAYLQEFREDEALYWFHKAYFTDSSRREPLIELAEFFYKKKDRQKVIAYTEAALTIPNNYFYANYQPYYTYYPHEMLYWAYWPQEKSKEHFMKALEFLPDNPKYLYDYRWYFDLPLISIIIPTLGRSEGLKKCLESIKNLIYPTDKIEIIVIEDEPRMGVPKRVAEGLARAKGEWIAYAANDMEFSPESLMQAIIYAKNTGKRLVAFNAGELLPDKGNICEHFIIHTSLIEKLGGEIFDTGFNHCGVDNLLWAKAEKLNMAIRCEKAKIIHNHFSKTGQMDEVYKLGWKEVEKDRKLLEKKLKNL